jgi:basic membrane lipoprotein Med (substrate-binding protein (PBP1-ABC) superfamily)
VARARWIALAVVAALAVGVAGCGSSEKGTDVKKIAFVAPYGDNEPDWTIQSKEVVDEFPRSLHIRADTVDASQTNDLRGVFEQVSHEGNQLVIAHDSRYAATAAAVAKDTGVPALVWGEQPSTKGAPVGHMTVQDKEGGYMAGIAATHAAITRRLGVIVAADGSDWDLATWDRTAGGFVAGARSVDPNVHIRFAQVGSDGDATGAQMHAKAAQMLREGVQMLLILGGKASTGAMRAVEATGGRDETLSIGVVSDKSATRRVEAGSVPIMLGSIMWETRPTFRKAVADVRAGTFADTYPLTLRNRGVWLYQTGRMPQDAADDAHRAASKIEQGTIHVPVTATSAAVESLIAGETPAG